MENKFTALNIWKKLQDNNYFENHRLYNFVPINPPTLTKDQINNKIVAEIGCGYGRETSYFTKYAKKVYAIEVSNTIIDKAKRFMERYGDIRKIKWILADEYKRKIPKNIDLVYSRLVFQHITPEDIQDYIETFYKKLKKGGIIHIQFRLGKTKNLQTKPEPTFQYSLEEIRYFFKKFKIVREIIKKEHIYITAKKVRRGKQFKLSKRKIYIVGGGTSLDSFNFASLRGKVTIAVNKSLLYVPNPTYFITMDYTFFDKITTKTDNFISKEEFKKLKCKKYFVVAGNNPYIVRENGKFVDKRWNYIYHLDHFDRIIYSVNAEGIGLNMKDFRHGCCSGFSALQLAVALGYDRIYLLGIDLDIDSNDTHYHGGYGENPDNFKSKLDMYYQYFVKGIKELKEKKPNIKIYNCSLNSKLKHILPYKEIK